MTGGFRRGHGKPAAPRVLTETGFRKIEHLTERFLKASEAQLHDRCSRLLLSEVFLEIDRALSGVGLSLRSVPPTPNTQELETLLLGIMLERELYASGTIRELGILKSVSHGFAVDGLSNMVGGASCLRTVVITDEKLSAYIDHVLDLGKISEYCQGLGLDVTEGRDRWERRTLRVGGSPPQWGFTVGQIYAAFEHPLFGKVPAESFDESLTRFIEFVCLLDYKPQWAVGTSLVHLNDYQPIYKILTPAMFGSTMSSLVESAFATASGGALDSSTELHESRRSVIEREHGRRKPDARTFAINREFIPPHVKYVTVKENNNCIVVGFDCDLDFERLDKFLGERGFKVLREKSVGVAKSVVNKGTHFDMRSRFASVDKRIVQDEDGNEIMVFKGADQALIFPKCAEELRKAGLALDTLYNNMLLCTPLLRDAEHGDTGLSTEERAVIQSFDTLVTLYRFFLEPIDGRIFSEMVARGEKGVLRAPLKSVMSMLEDVPGGFEERVLHVLNAMDARINPSKFVELYGGEAETQEKASLYYTKLKLLIEQFGRIVSKRAA